MSSRTSIAPYLRRTPLLWVGAVVLLLGVIFGLIGVVATFANARFAADGATAEGIVLSKDTHFQAGSTSTFYSIRYRFTLPSDHTYQGSSSVGEQAWASVVEGGPVTVQYLVSDPSTNRIADAGSLIFGGTFLVIGTVLSLGAGVLVWRSSRTLLEDRRLLRVGLEAQATVAAVEPTRISVDEGVEWVISYAYRDAAGTDHEGRSRMMSAKEAAAFKPGDQATIRYDPDRPAKSLWITHNMRASQRHRSAIDKAAPRPGRRRSTIDAPAGSADAGPNEANGGERGASPPDTSTDSQAHDAPSSPGAIPFGEAPPSGQRPPGH